MYSKKLLDRFQNPKHVKEMENPSSTGQVGNPACGDVMKIFLKIEPGAPGRSGAGAAKAKIIDASVQTYGCVAAIAASDALCEIAIGKTIEEAEKLVFQDVIDALGGEVPQVKVHCSQLGISALKKAIDSYKSGKSKVDSKCENCPGYKKSMGVKDD
ncbi:MAG: iron-sulfur cluster assembly scaffold protein [Candidatus Undinarchaeales archaeon]|nr:iron-sulfur cluster assembly scaffold protein [Candidatus Undinarchaeales archaeon]